MPRISPREKLDWFSAPGDTVGPSAVAGGTASPPRPFSKFLTERLREVEALLQGGDRNGASALAQDLLQAHGLVVDLESGEWRSRGGWHGQLGSLGPPRFEGELKAAAKKAKRRRGRHVKKRNPKEPARDRHRIFADWLVSTFGRETLSSGAGVLDIAGGKGLLTAELQERHGIPCTLVEERAPPSDVRVSGADNNGVPTRKAHSVPLAGAPFVRRWEELAHTSKQLSEEGGVEEEVLPPGHSLLRLCAECSVMVGMHPDEVTEAIIDTALSLGKPFAVVPCCVFTELFPDRRTAQGGVVRTYTEFMAYLLRKHAELREAQLGFLGRSRVIHWKPRQQEGSSQ